MRAVAIADVHLGFKGPGRTAAGRNQRELDVEAAWDAAVATVLAEPGVDLVTIAGDVFHHPRVSHHAVRAYRRGIRKITEAGIPVVVAQGNHDAAKNADTLSPIFIPEDLPGLHIVTEPARVEITARSTGERVSVAVFPFVALGTGESYRVEPDASADVNVLLVHAAVKAGADGRALPHFYGSDGALDVDREAGRWDAICLGDYHEFTRLHPTELVFYSGAVERTSSNIWKENGPKGVVVYDTAAGEMRLVEHATRPMFDLDLDDILRDYAASSDTVNAALRNIEGQHDCADALVRLRVDDFPRDERTAIDWSLVREIKRRCAHFLLDLHLAAARTTVESGDRRAGERRSIEDEAREALKDEEPAVAELVMHFLLTAGTSTDTPAREAA